MHARALRGPGLITLLLASCVRGDAPPAVSPSSTLAPPRDGDGPRTEAPFQVVFSGPRGAITQQTEGVVSVLFNRPMRSLDDADDAGLPGATITTKDGRPVPGRWHWVGTRGLIFEPTGGFPSSSELEVFVPAATRALDGSTLAAEHRFSFSTPRPTVVRSTLAGRKDLKPDAVFRLELDQPIEPAEVAKVAKLTVRAKPTDKERAIGVTVRRATGVPAAKAAHFVEVVPTEKLPLDHAVQLVIDKGLKGAQGPLTSLEPQVFAMRTYGPLRLADVRCPKSGLGRCQQGARVDLELTNAVAAKDFLAHLEVTPPLLSADGVGKLLVKGGKPTGATQPVIANAQAGKRYKVKVRKGLKDVFGQTLEKDLVVDVDVEAPFAGGVATSTAAPYGDEGPAIATEPKPVGVPHRPKLAFEAKVGVRGHVVEALAKTGIKSHVVPIGIVNVPTVGTYASALDEELVVKWLDGSLRAAGPTGGGWTWDWLTPGVAENVRAVRSYDLDALLGGAGKKGSALLATAVPGSAAPNDAALLTVTDLGVSARMSKFGGLVWITRLSTGKPVENASVKLVRLRPKKGAGKEAFSTTTDASGLATIPADAIDPTKPEDESVFVVRAGDDWTWQRVQRSTTSATSWWDLDLSQKGTYRGLLFTDRGVYRPGEKVKLAGFVRRSDAAGLTSPAGKDVRLRVRDGEWNEILQTRAKVDAFGAFSIDVPLPRTSKLGSAQVEASVGGDEVLFTTSFLLAAYKASAFKVAVEPEHRAYVRGDQAKIAIAGEYLYGAPMEAADVRTTISRAPVSFTPPKADDFVFGDDEGPQSYGSVLETPEGTLDAKGRWVPTVKLAMPGQRGPERVTIEAEVQDATQQTVAKSASVLVHPAEIYLGLKRGGARFVTLGASKVEVKPEVAAFDPAGARRAGVPVTIELFSRKWTGVVAEQPDGSSWSSSKPKDELVGTCTTKTTATVASCALPVNEPGFYLVRAVAKDARGNETRVGTSMYVVSEAPAAKPGQTWAKSDLRVVRLEAEKGTYKVGEKAKILVHNPFKEAEALVTVERGGVLRREVVTLKGPMPVVEVPVDASWFPNAFVSIDLVRGRVQAPPATGLDLGGPELRVGTTEIKIDPESHRLKVAITPSKSQTTPGETIDADVAVTDAEGKPTKASVTFYAVDEGVLMLTGYKTPDPLPPFAERTRLAVFGVENRDHLARILPMKAGEKVPILGWETQEIDGWSKGSAFGDGEGRPTPRADFRATAFFEAGRVTGEDGRAKFRVKLPDNLTTFRLMAVAAAGDDRFGFGEGGVTSSKRLMLRPALPRQLRVGDTFEAAFVVATKGLAASEVDVSLKAQGVMVEGPSTARVKVAPGAQVPVRFKVKVENPGLAKLDAEAKGGGASDRVLLEKRVVLPVSPKSVAAYGETTGAAAIQLGKLEGLRPDEGGLKVKVASSAMVGLDSSFEQLIEYPYGCTEQVASRTLPLLALRDLAKDAGARLPAKLDDAIADGVARLLTHQTGNGGFGFWDDDQPIPWLSAYATFVIEEAARKGYPVPKDARDRAVSYLRGHLYVPKDDDAHPDEGDGYDPSWYDPSLPQADKLGLEFANAAMIVDALASIGEPDPGTINRLYDVRAGKPLFAQAFLLHAMARAKLPQGQIDALVKEIEGRLRVGANDATAAPEGPVYAPMLDSGVRTTALVLRAFMEVAPKHPLGARLARGLLAARTDGAWRSTQENVWALVALDAYRRAQEPTPSAFDVKAWVGDQELGHARLEGLSEQSWFVPSAKLPKGATVAFALTGQGKLFYAAELRYVSSMLPTKPLDRGFFVDRRIRSVTPAALADALKTFPKASETKLRMGDLVLIDVMLESAEPRDQVVIDDPLPGGVEPIDVRLETVASTQAIGEGAFVAHATAAAPHAVPKGAFLEARIHREHKDDRVLTFVPHLEPGLYHFRYLARATSAGTFVLPPASVEAMYQPEISGRTAATTVQIVRE